MNMKMKVLAAAVTMAITGGANAATALISSGNSELIFTVWDSVAQVSFDMDLTPNASAPSSMGTFTLNDFLPTGVAAGGKSGSSASPTITGWSGAAPGTAEAKGINWQWDIDGSVETSAAWTSFTGTVAAKGSSSANWQWFVGGGDSTGATTAVDQYRYDTTSKVDLTTVTISSSQLNGMKNTNALWNAMDNGSPAADPSYSFTNLQGDGYVGNTFQDNWQGQAPFVATAGVNESMGFYYLTGNCVGTVCETGSRADAQKFGEGAKWTFAQTSPGQFGLTYETNPVPVPAAVWLLGSALVGLVGVARRRTAA